MAANNWVDLGGNSGMEYMNVHGGTFYRFTGNTTLQPWYVPVKEEERAAELKKIANG